MKDAQKALQAADSKGSHLRNFARNRVVAPIRSAMRVRRNDPCPCGSGAKYKKCCGGNNRTGYVRTPDTPATVTEYQPPSPKYASKPSTANAAPASNLATVAAMYRANVSHDLVWAYWKTGNYITPQTQNTRTEEEVAAWEQARQEFSEDPEANTAKLLSLF